jgi:hypothetical protein
MTISSVTVYTGGVPDKTIQTQSVFSVNASTWTAYQADVLVTDINVTINGINVAVIQINNDVISAANSAANAAISENTAVAAANFKGRWSDAVGAATVPSTYSNNGQTWQLLQNIADITADEPLSLAANWQVVNDINMANVRLSKIMNPKVRILADNDPAGILRKGTALSVTRAGSAQYKDIYGIIRTAAPDELRPEKEGFLREPSGINLALHNRAFDNGYWSKTLIVITPNAAIAPDGNMTADRYLGSAGTHNLTAAVTYVGTEATISMWVKSNGAGGDVFRILLNNSTARSGDLTATAEWKLFQFTSSALVAGVNAIGIVAGTGDLATDVLIWGIQVEENPFATSVMYSDAAVGIRAADELKIEVNGNFLSSAEGDHTQIIKYKLLGDTGAGQYIYSTVSTGASDDKFSALSATANGVVSYSDGSAQGAFTPSLDFDVEHTIALVTKSGVMTAYGDGVAGATVVLVADDTIDLAEFVYLGADGTGLLPASGHFSLFEGHDIALNIDEIKLLRGQ